MTDWAGFTIVSAIVVICLARVYKARTQRSVTPFSALLLVPLIVVLTGVLTAAWRAFQET
ncbi:hypothetical protein V0R50_11425 [Pseudomonas sp. 148P]|uniref:Uncharacterized protein n=1 Tax=Pseudomonas ulcerans TaxID=3115852 RepID=A0ABU7HQL5_9PSED|nr:MULTISPECIES: hypothetical protein [unclassified Pseudomonas]MEE1923773.1 hypothetical protein [Pseudomonas sp. 147P]MEE1933833.1 hypothetical protein [Pseudomonas sp. 148P]